MIGKNEMQAEKSHRYFERAKRVAPGGVHSPVRAFRNVGGVPRFISRGAKACLMDVDGNQFVDYCMSWGPLILGHCHEEVKEAVHRAIDLGWTFGAAETISLELAELITSEIPWVETIRFVNSGTEAVMSALRLARAATGRDRILKFAGCYHGHTDSMLVKAGSGLAEASRPDSAGVTDAVVRDTIVISLDDVEAVRKAFAEQGSRLAAVILEPLPANYGLLPQREVFIRDFCERARHFGALVIFDEVITGFRAGFTGMAGKLGVEPDLVTYGKIIGGGFPVGAYGGRRDLMRLVAPEGPVYQAGTLSANPVAMTAGLMTLKILLRERPYALLEKKVRTMARALEKECERSAEIPVHVQHYESVFWIVFGLISGNEGVVRKPESIPELHRQTFGRIYEQLLRRGVYLAPSACEVGFLSTAHTDEQNECLVVAVKEALKEISA